MQDLDRKARLKAAVKPRDGWWATVFTTKFSIKVVSALGDTRVTPNQVTLFALIIALAAAALIYWATPAGLIAAAVLIQIAFIFDCADGQLARFKKTFSDLGGWYDQVADRIREFALMLALTAGYHRLTGDDSIWVIGFAAFFVMYMLEYYSQQKCQIPSPVDPNEPPARVQNTGAENLDAFEGTLDRLLPVAAFRMGEQLLIVSAFLLVAGITGDIVWVKWLLIGICLLGGAHMVYRPARRLRAYFVWQKKLRAESSATLPAGDTAMPVAAPEGADQ